MNPQTAQMQRPETPSIDADSLRAAERRTQMAVKRPPGHDQVQWALCLSGGGIRSATFCLGVLQGLAKSASPLIAPQAPNNESQGGDPKQDPDATLLNQFDCLSTVSGGGYAGAFFSSLFIKGRLSGATTETDGQAAKRAYQALLADPPGRMHSDTQYSAQQPGAVALAWLRDNGRYLAPNGAGDLMYAASIAIRNWLAMHFVIATSMLMLLSLLLLFRIGATFMPNYVLLAEFLYPVKVGLIWWSTTWLMVAMMFCLCAVPLGMAFWLTHPSPGQGLSDEPRIITAASTMAAGLGAFGLACGAVGAWFYGKDTVWAVVLIGGGALTLLAIVYFAVSVWICRPPTISAHRVCMTRGLSNTLGWSLLVAALAIVETAAMSAAAYMGREDFLPTSAVIAAVVWLTRFIAQRLPEKKSDSFLKKYPLDPLAGVAGIVLWFLLAVLYELFLLWIVADGNPSSARLFAGVASYSTLYLAAATTAALYIVAWVSGQFPGFLNLSTLQGFYSARLTRTYLGASNHARFADTTAKKRSVAEPVRGDSFDVETLHANPMAPIHYINVCMNQTIGPDAQLVQRDRKGKPLVVAPSGFYLDGTAHVFPPQGTGGDMASRLSVGEWIGVSGAAFTTGLGRSTSLGYSLLLGFANLRLGRWWRSDVRSKSVEEKYGGASGPINSAAPVKRIGKDSLLRQAFTPQFYLIDEILGRFHGTRLSCQYLSDGGHFENTAAYEMLRPERKVALLVVCDCGADPDYQFDDLANLIRLARIDHGIEIKVNVAVAQPDHTLSPFFTVPNELRRRADGTLPPPKEHCAILLDVFAPTVKTSSDAAAVPKQMTARILMLKPKLIDNAAADILNYQQQQPSFPQESTGDQFFDEAQWESYRKLGVEIASRVFPKDSNSAYGQAFWKSVLVA